MHKIGGICQFFIFDFTIFVHFVYHFAFFFKNFNFFLKFLLTRKNEYGIFKVQRERRTKRHKRKASGNYLGEIKVQTRRCAKGWSTEIKKQGGRADAEF